MQLTRPDIDSMVAAAAIDLRKLAPDPADLKVEHYIEVADRHDLPLGVQVENDAVARAIFVQAYRADEHIDSTLLNNAVWQRFEQIASLEA